jgi:hypothetical protein
MDAFVEPRLVGDVPLVEEEEFVEWCVAHGVRAPLLRYPAYDSSGLRGIVAQADVPPGSTLISVPASICINSGVARSDPVVGRAWDDPAVGDLFVDVDVLLASYVAWIRTVAQDAHRLWPWVRVLPDVDTVADWGEEALTALQDPVLSEAGRAKSAASRALAARVTGALATAFPALFPADKYTPVWWMWAHKHLSARAFGRRIPTVFLVPLADCFNHGPVSMKYALEEEGEERPLHAPAGEEEVDPYAAREARLATTGGVHVPSGTFRIFLTHGARFRNGDQVCISYGRRDNAFLALEYGFVLDINEFDTVLVSPKPVLVAPPAEGMPLVPTDVARSNAPTACPVPIPANAAALFAAVSAAGCACTLSPNAWAGELMPTFRVAAADEEDVTAWRAGKHLFWSRPVSRANEGRALRAAAAYLRDCLAAHPTSLAEDEEVLAAAAAAPIPYRLRIAIVYRSARKRILKAHAAVADGLAALVDAGVEGAGAGGDGLKVARKARSGASYMRAGAVTPELFAVLAKPPAAAVTGAV